VGLFVGVKVRVGLFVGVFVLVGEGEGVGVFDRVKVLVGVGVRVGVRVKVGVGMHNMVTPTVFELAVPPLQRTDEVFVRLTQFSVFGS